MYRTDNGLEVFEIRDTFYNGNRVERKAYLYWGDEIWEMRLGLSASLDPAKVKQRLWSIAQEMKK